MTNRTNRHQAGGEITHRERPLTPLMHHALEALERHGTIRKSSMTTAEKNTARALCDRGLVDFDLAARGYTITALGRSHRRIPKKSPKCQPKEA